jgi:hypothetical protein
MTMMQTCLYWEHFRKKRCNFSSKFFEKIFQSNIHFRKDRKTLEYKQFLLTLLEYDYAAILARTRSNGINNQLHKFTKISTRGMNFGTMEDLDNIPLAYLLLCKFVTGTRTIQELEPEYLNKLIIGELLMNFDPVAVSGIIIS